MKTYAAAAALLVAMTACNGGNRESLEGTLWKLTSMPGIPAEAIASEVDAFTLQFDAAESMVAGRTNCNRFFGRYELKGRELEFENMGMTRMACPDMQYEDMFVRMLDDVDSYRIRRGELTLYDDEHVVAVFKAMPGTRADETAPAQPDRPDVGMAPVRPETTAAPAREDASGAATHRK